jgi:lactoylglutathione lyase
MDLKLTRLQHIGIPVTNLKKSILFYESLGFCDVMTSQFPFGNEQGDVTMMKLGDMMIELYQYPPSERHAIGKRSHGHIDHIAFDVADIHHAYATLKGAGHHMLEEAPVFLPFWKNGCKYFNIAGPDGERLEFNQILS